jgi:hypothetical protein
MVKQKLIVTHYSPDIDAVGAVWVLKRFSPEYFDAKLDFVPAGEKISPKKSRSFDVVHVDTGLGPFDHHQSNNYTSAARLVWDALKKERELVDEAVERVVDLVTAYDQAVFLRWDEAMEDRAEMAIYHVIDGWKAAYPGKNRKYVEWGMIYFDGLYQAIKSKIAAKKTIEEKGAEFKTRWGKGVAIETKNDKVLEIAEKMGYAVVVKREKDGFLRIYSRADKGVDLTGAYEKFKKLDPLATWYLHPSKCLLLNGSRKKPGMKPSTLALGEVVKIISDS